MLSVRAFNALLKTLEEPPSYCIFILATTDPQKVPVTILSRCQRYDFKRLSVDIIADRLEELTSLENINVEPRALRYIARLADGAMRDALSMLDQCIAFNFKDVLTYDNVLNVLGAVDMQVFGSLYEAVEKRDVLGCMRVLDEVIIQGRDLGQFVTDYTWYLRNLLILLTADGAEDIIDMSRENMERLKSQAEGADPASIMRYIRVFSELSNTIRYDAQKRIRIELALIKLCKPSMERNDDSLMDRIRALEQRMDEAPVVNQGAVVIRSEAVAEEAPREVPAALPEDIKKIVHNWSSLVGEAMGMTRASLRNAYPSIDDSGRLMIVTHVKSEADYLKGEFGRKDMEELFFRHVAAKVDYVVEQVPVDGSKDKVNPNLLKIEGVEILIETDSSEEDEEYV
jgi:DNA polymerase-3 subunit gamma/tau